MPLEKLNGQEIQAFCAALLSAFPNRERLVIMVRTRLDAKLEEIIGEGNSLTAAVFNLVDWAEANGRLRDLLEGAVADNETNESLRQLHVRLLSSPGVPIALSSKVEIFPPPGLRAGMERFQSVSLDSLIHWQRRLQECAQAICRIEKENTVTTGFLVGPDIVMTCYWAVEDLISKEMQGVEGNVATPLPVTQSVVLRFRQMTSGASALDNLKSTIPPVSSTKQGQIYVLADSWLIDSDRERNYALLRVKGMPGMDRGVGGESRRWLRPTVGYQFQRGEPLLIVSYPPGETAVLTYGMQERTRRNGWQVEYMAQTPFGSAGSPCFNAELQLVAMHFGRRPEQEKAENAPITNRGQDRTEVSLEKYGVLIPALLRRERFLTALLEDLPFF